MPTGGPARHQAQQRCKRLNEAKQQGMRILMNSVSVIAVVAVFSLQTFSVQAIAMGEGVIPACSSGAPQSHNGGLLGTLTVPDDLAKIYGGALSKRNIVIEVRRTIDGEIACASPLAGLSIFWPYAIAQIAATRQPGSGELELFRFDDPTYPFFLDIPKLDAKKGQDCASVMDWEQLVKLGWANARIDHLAEASACFQKAKSLRPRSIAASYGIARSASGSDRVPAYQALAALAPEFYEPRITLAAVLSTQGHFEESENTLMAIVGEAPPLPVQLSAYDRLAYEYDQLNRRRESTAARATVVKLKQEIWRRDTSIVDSNDLGVETKNLAAIEEESGDFNSSVTHFGEAVELLSNPKTSEAVRFEADLGRIRSLRKLGREGETQEACSSWNHRLRALGSELENAHWGGKELSTAQWEFSCGNTRGAFDAIERILKRKPTMDAYQTLERFYRALGQEEPARRTHELGLRFREARDQAILGAIFAEADEIIRNNRR